MKVDGKSYRTLTITIQTTRRCTVLPFSEKVNTEEIIMELKHLHRERGSYRELQTILGFSRLEQGMEEETRKSVEGISARIKQLESVLILGIHYPLLNQEIFQEKATCGVPHYIPFRVDGPNFFEIEVRSSRAHIRPGVDNALAVFYTDARQHLLEAVSKTSLTRYELRSVIPPEARKMLLIAMESFAPRDIYLLTAVGDQPGELGTETIAIGIKSDMIWFITHFDTVPLEFLLSASSLPVTTSIDDLTSKRLLLLNSQGKGG